MSLKLDKKDISIAILLICILTMAIGYSVLSQKLNVEGISSITSVFDIKITNIKSTATGYATDAIPPTHTATTATFSTNLVVPKDKMTYDITIENQGTFDAVLDDIILTYSDIPAITFTTSGVQKGDVLKVGEKTLLTVEVEYSDTITTQPEEISISATLTLNYTQYISEGDQPVDFANYMAKRTSWTTKWFDLDRETIEYINFVPYNEVPSDVGDNYFDISDAQNGSVMAWYYDTDDNGLYEVTIGQDGGVVANPDSSYLFYALTALTHIDFENFYTDIVTTMYYMFVSSSSLLELDLSGWNTSNVTDMYRMFYDCKSLKSINLEGFDTSNIENFSMMFYNCSSLVELDLSAWDTSNVTSITNMFSGCSSLTSINLSGWDISNVTSLALLFENCKSLETAIFDGWDTSNVTTMESMFKSCRSLKELDLSGFDTSKVTNMQYMFYTNSALQKIYVSDLWDTSSVKSSAYMFRNCTKLSGAISYSSSYTSVAYANYTTGYLTYKAAPAN